MECDETSQLPLAGHVSAEPSPGALNAVRATPTG